MVVVLPASVNACGPRGFRLGSSAAIVYGSPQPRISSAPRRVGDTLWAVQGLGLKVQGFEGLGC